MTLKEIIRTVEAANYNLKKLGRKELFVDVKFDTQLSRTVTTIEELNDLIAKQSRDVKDALKVSDININGCTTLLKSVKEINKVDNFTIWVKVYERF